MLLLMIPRLLLVELLEIGPSLKKTRRSERSSKRERNRRLPNKPDLRNLLSKIKEKNLKRSSKNKVPPKRN